MKDWALDTFCKKLTQKAYLLQLVIGEKKRKLSRLKEQKLWSGSPIIQSLNTLNRVWKWGKEYLKHWRQ